MKELSGKLVLVTGEDFNAKKTIQRFELKAVAAALDVRAARSSRQRKRSLL